MEDCISEILEDTLAEIDCNDEEGSYIEIKLDTAPPTCYNDDQNKRMDDDGEQEEYQLRISISSGINVHTNEPKVDAIGAPCIPSPMNCSVDDTISTYADSQVITPLQHPDGVEIEFPVQNWLSNSVSANPTVSWESPQPDGQTTILRTTRVIPCDNVDVLYTGKQPNLTTTTTTNGVMMKLLIKFRGIKIGALLASLLKPRQPSQANNAHKSSKKSKPFFQCYQKSLVKPSNGRCTSKRDHGSWSKHWNLEDDSTCGFFRSSKNSNRVMEMDLGALRGIFNAMGMNTANKGSKSKRRSGSTTSCNTSPIHEEFSSCSSHENSIHAAIAYCKSSFGQTSDFTFRSSISSSPSSFVTYPV